MENQDFLPGMKVSLNDEFGVVLNKANDHLLVGMIRWDTREENDIEDWRGLFGSFLQAGGKIIEPDYKFMYINDDGSMRKVSH